MAFIQSIAYFALILVYFFGQLLRLEFSGISFPLIDLLIAFIFIINIFTKIRNKDFKIENKFLLYFLIFSWLNFIFHLPSYPLINLKALFYLLRLTFLFSFFIISPNIDKKVKKFFYLSIIANIIFGLIQYFFWPDFTVFKSLNWDPHLYRLVSTFFDPTFTALIYLFFIIFLFLKKNFPYKKLILTIAYLALALTYSRATYLSFFIAFTFIAFYKKSLKIFIITLLLVLSTIYFLPRFEGEGTKLERTSSITAKIQNYKEASFLFSKNPIIGYGYNNLFHIRNTDNPNSHAISGFDGSLMTILVTNGTIGLLLFVLGLKKIFIKGDLLVKSLLISLLVHSLFANSLLYPWILLFFIFI